MTGPRARHDREVERITEALGAPLPPARLSTDPTALWACGRHARRISTEARISLVVTTAQVGALAGVLAVLVSFVDWHGLWAVSSDAITADPNAAIYAVIALVAIGAAVLMRRSSSGIKA